MDKTTMKISKNNKKNIALTTAVIFALSTVGFAGCSAYTTLKDNNNALMQEQQKEELSFSFISHDKDNFKDDYCDHDHEFIKLASKPHDEIITHSNQDLEYVRIYKLDKDNNIGKKIGSKVDIKANTRIVIRCNLKEEYPNILIEFKVKDGDVYRYIPLHNSNCDSFDFEYVK